MLTFLLTQTTENWQLSVATESLVIFKPIETDDPTAAIEFHPRTDKPEKAFAILKGKGAQQDLFFQKEIKSTSYLSVAASMYELIFMDKDGLGL